MSRKIFMSVLGTSLYEECDYYIESKENPIRSRFIQEATIRHFCQNWTSEDQIIIFTTEQSFQLNYNEQIEKRFDIKSKKEIPYQGLGKVLQELKLTTPYKHIKVKDGNSEEELWDIFDTIFYELKEEDEIYFDITHSFRYLPLLLMILLSYSRYLNNTKIKSITYGNYELSKEQNGLAPIMNLMPLVLLNDWSIAVNNFEKFGEVELISSLCQESLKPILKINMGADKDLTAINSFSKYLPCFVKMMKTCRGKEIISGELANKINNMILDVEKTTLPPFNPIFVRLKAQIHKFASTDNVKNGLIAVEWCIQNGLVQQGLTMLQETIISLVCESEDLQLTDKNARLIISSAFKIHYEKISPEKWEGICIVSTENKMLTEKFLQNPLLKLLTTEFKSLTDFRNDINHFGMTNQNKGAKSFEENLQKIFNSVTEKISEIDLQN